MKTAIFLLATMFLGMSIFNNATIEKTTTSVAATKNHVHITSEPRIDFILGTWAGTGFVTDANGLEQYLEIEEHNSSVSNDRYHIVGVCKNPGNDYVYTYDKFLFFNPTLKEWYTNGTINNSILPKSGITLSEHYPLSHTCYYDLNGDRVRYTTTRDTDDSFTETQEKWGQNGWGQTAWFRMTRIPNK
jgi:hypothetical protein